MVSTTTDRLYGESSGVAVKAPVVAVTNGIALPLTGLTSVGSYAPQEGDRILVKDQADATTNGIYNASVSAWQRAGDFDGAYDAVNGTLVIANLNNGQALIFQLTTANPITIGPSPLYFSPFWQPANVAYPQTPAEALAGVAPVDTSILPGYITRYGALISAADNTTAIRAAIAQALQSSGVPWRVPCGTWKYSGSLVINGPCEGIGDDQYTAILQKTAAVVGIQIVDGIASAQASLQGFTLSSSAAGDTSDGLQINTNGRVRCRQLYMVGHGGHGLNILQGDVGRYDDITTLNNGGDGVRLAGSVGVQANANTFTNIDSRGNTGWGFNVMTGMANMGTGITCQSNTAGGIQFDACFGNVLDVYSESNVGPAISFTAACAAPNFGGNLVRAAFADASPTFAGNSGLANAVWTMKPGPTFQPMFSRVLTDALRFSNQRTDGGEPTGVLEISHTINNQYDFSASSGADALFNWANSGGVTNHASTGYVAASKGFYPNGFNAGANPGMFSGVGSPAGVVNAPVGSIYMNSSGGAGTTLYVKESGGAGSSGWVGK